MKNVKKPIMYLVLILTPILFSKCTITEDLGKLQDSIDSLKINIGTPEFNALVHIEFIDAKTKAYMSDGVKVTLSGKNAADIYNNIGERSATYTSIIGMLDLVVDPHKVDTNTIQTNPVEFDVNTSVTGYANVTQKVIMSENKVKSVTISLIKLSDAPQGVSVNQKSNFTTSASDGKVLQTATASMNAGSQTVEIPAGVVLKDAAGKPMSGTVSSQIIYFDPTSTDAQAAIPGGLDVSAKLANGTTDQVSFLSAGMFNVALTVGGAPVKSFDGGGLKIKTNVSPALINPNTGLPVKNGDVIEMWSIEEGSGNWVFEKMDTIRSVNGELVLEETVKHLSSWNWDFHYMSCGYGPKIIWKGDLSNPAMVKVNAKMQNNVYQRTTYVKANPKDAYDRNMQIYNTPTNVPTIITFSEQIAKPIPQFSFAPSTLDIANLCDGKTYEVTITENPQAKSQYITVNTDFSLTSSSSSAIVIKPNATLYFKPTIDYQWTYAGLRSGVASLKILMGVDYDVYASFGSSYGFAKLKVEDLGNNTLNITLTPTVSFGSIPQSNQTRSYITPKPTNNIVVVKYDIVLPADIFGQLQ